MEPNQPALQPTYPLTGSRPCALFRASAVLTPARHSQETVRAVSVYLDPVCRVYWPSFLSNPTAPGPARNRIAPQTGIPALKLSLRRNLLLRMGFQKIWRALFWTTRLWERARQHGRAQDQTEAGRQTGLDPASDAAIMLRVAAGDESGFNYLVGKYHRAMIHFLFRMVHNQAIAEELAQEVFLRVYRSRESYRAEAKFTTWLYRIATNLAVNHARDTRHERAAQTIYLDAPDEETGTTPDVADDEPSVEQRLLTDERMAAIRTHVMALPERQRMAVLMHKYQGMDYRQIGEVLKLSESATKSLLFRAYQTLRDKLKDFV